jgi:hypothetical protein
MRDGSVWCRVFLAGCSAAGTECESPARKCRDAWLKIGVPLGTAHHFGFNDANQSTIKRSRRRSCPQPNFPREFAGHSLGCLQTTPSPPTPSAHTGPGGPPCRTTNDGVPHLSRCSKGGIPRTLISWAFDLSAFNFFHEGWPQSHEDYDVHAAQQSPEAAFRREHKQSSNLGPIETAKAVN